MRGALGPCPGRDRVGAHAFDRGGDRAGVTRLGEQQVVAEIALDHGQARGDDGQAHVYVLEQLDRQQQLGEAVAQRRHDAQVGFGQPRRDLLHRRRLGRDPHPFGRCLGRKSRQVPCGLGVGAVDVEGDLLAAVAQQRYRPDQSLDAEAVGEAAVVDDPQLALGGWRQMASRRSPKIRSSGVFITTCVFLASMPRSCSSSRASSVTKMWPSARAALSRSSARISRTRGWPGERSKRVAKSSGKVSWKLSIKRHAAQLWPQGGEDERVGHVVDLDQVEAAAAVEGVDLARGSSEEARVALEVGASAAARLARPRRGAGRCGPCRR